MSNEARKILSKAIKQGEVVRPDSCQSCGRTVSIDGHHPDYDQPLKVMWLCRQCHIRLHKNSITPRKELNPNIKTMQISASPELWRKFDEWRQKQGCTSLAEGIRIAMREVSNFEVKTDNEKS